MIRVEGIRKVFNAHSRNANEVLKGVSFELPEKGLVAIFGKSGSGKTTLLNIIGGLDKKDAGHVYIDGEDTQGKVDYIRNAKIGYIFQNYYLENGYTIAEIMRHAMLIAGFKDEEEIAKRTDEVLHLVKMDRYKNKKSDALSGGQKQRVAIARALIKGSDIILADEPTGNLDAENTIIIMDILKEISKTQLVVLVTHEVTLIHNYADSHIKIVDGELKDNEELEKDIKYEVDRNNIYVDSKSKKTYDVGVTNVNVYGQATKTDDIEIFTEDGSVYIRPGKGVTILDENSEKRIIFDTDKNNEEDKIDIEPIPKFTKSGAKKNGRLFTLSSIFKSMHSDEKAWSSGNVFKNIFIIAMAIVMCFFSLQIFEISRIDYSNKEISKNDVYLNINTYDDLRLFDEQLYDKVDFFDTQLSQGDFSFAGITSLSGIKADYVLKPIESDMTKEDFSNLNGEMPKLREVLISQPLANELKNKFRLKELYKDNAIMQIRFDGEYGVSGVVDGDSNIIYMNKQDYVNFLGVYNEVMFYDVEDLFFSKDYENIGYSSEILIADKDMELDKNQVHVEINRNSLYKMMKEIKEADSKVKTANAMIKAGHNTSIEIRHSYPLYVHKLEITRDVMTTDLRIYVTKEAMDNIFVYLCPNIKELDNKPSSKGLTSKYFFEVQTNSEEQLETLNNRLVSRSIGKENIAKIYSTENQEIYGKAVSTLTIFLVMIVLLFFIYYFIEKSGSLKNSKEYGIYRAIGVNKSNLLYKEIVRTLIQNILIYLVFFVIITAIMVARYFMMNIIFTAFIGIAAGIFAATSILMMVISLVPYLFVLVKTPSSIIARYDI